MQGKQEFWHNEGQDISSRTQYLIEYLSNLSKHDYKPSADTLKAVTGFVLDLPEPYKTIGLRAITAHF